MPGTSQPSVTVNDPTCLLTPEKGEPAALAGQCSFWCSPPPPPPLEAGVTCTFLLSCKLRWLVLAIGLLGGWPTGQLGGWPQGK